MNIHDMFCPDRDCYSGKIPTAIWDDDTRSWIPIDYICKQAFTPEQYAELEAEEDARYADI